VPLVFVVFPSTVLFPRDNRTDAAVAMKRPVPLSVTLEFETLTVATPVELLCASMAVKLLNAEQFSTLSSAGAVVEEMATNPLKSNVAMLLLTKTFDPSAAVSPSPICPLAQPSIFT
jgi:hypothetical protein